MENYDYLYKDIWSKTLDSIKQDPTTNIREDEFSYFDRSRLYEYTDQTATITTPYEIDSMIMNGYRDIIASHLSRILEKDINVYITYEKSVIPQVDETNKLNNEFYYTQIEQEYLFTNFVIGKSNSQAHIASLTCAANPGLSYNPLFIYGNSGLGKTHLLKAVANKVLEEDPRKNIIYISGQKFVDAVYQASKDKRLDQFKESFYGADLLIVDDIQFISGNKEKTQEIFFSIFTELVNKKKQICIAADKKPMEIVGLEERIITRFNQGLVVSISAPEYETSYTIVLNKINRTKDNHTQIDDDVIAFIASNLSHDVRSLEGAVVRLLFVTGFINKTDHIDLKSAKLALADLLKEANEDLSISRIKKEVCNYYNVSNQQLCSASRTKTITTPRQIAMYLCRKHLDSSYETIGIEFGNRDHSTVINSCEKIEELIKTDVLYKNAIEDIERRLFQQKS